MSHAVVVRRSTGNAPVPPETGHANDFLQSIESALADWKAHKTIESITKVHRAAHGDPQLFDLCADGLTAFCAHLAVDAARSPDLGVEEEKLVLKVIQGFFVGGARCATRPAARRAALVNLIQIAVNAGDLALAGQAAGELEKIPDLNGDERFLCHAARRLTETVEIERSPIRPTLVLHPGFVRSGSTWLQRSWFPFLVGSRHLGTAFCEFVGTGGSVGQVSFPTALRAPSLKMAQGTFDSDALVEEARVNGSQGRVTTLSDERLLYMGNRSVFLANLADLSQRKGLDVSLVLVIRRPKDAVRSLFAYEVANKRITAPIDSVVTFDQGVETRNISITDFDYYKIYARILEIIPQENVRIIPFEKMFADIAGSMEGFPGSEPGSSPFLHLLAQTSPANRTAKPGSEGEALLQELDVTLNEVDRALADSCRSLDRALELGLGDLGYY